MLLYTLASLLFLTSLTLSTPLDRRQTDCVPIPITIINPLDGSTLIDYLPCPTPTPTTIDIPSPATTSECSPLPTTIVNPADGSLIVSYVPCPAPAATEPPIPTDGTSPTSTTTALDPDGTMSCWFEPWLCNTNIPAPDEEASPPPPLDGVPPAAPTPDDTTLTDITPADTTPTSYPPIATDPDPNLIPPGPLATLNNIYCGGIAGLPCPEAMFCSADPSAPVDCVDCSGICVPINTK